MMSSVSKVIAGLGLVFFTTLTPAVAAATGGTVSFSGILAQDPCLIAPGNNQIGFSCPDNGGRHTQQVSIQQAERGKVTLPGVAKVSLTYLNPQKSQAIVQVDYN